MRNATTRAPAVARTPNLRRLLHAAWITALAAGFDTVSLIALGFNFKTAIGERAHKAGEAQFLGLFLGLKTKIHGLQTTLN